jgi:outer membrane immunogenic protein
MKRIALLTVAAMGIGFTHGAMAADLPMRAAPAYVAPVVVAPTWTGAYLGFNGGWGWTGNNNSNNNLTFSGPGFAAFALGGTGSNNANSPVFGGQAGYNYQVSNWVFGVEGDVDGANIRASQGAFIAPGAVAGFGGGSGFLTEKQTWLASLRARVGYTWGPGMIYVTGGGAWSNVQVNGGATLFAAGTTNTFTVSTTRSGYTVGAGYEWMIAPNWAVRAEYLYYAFTGAVSGSTLFPAVPVTVTANANKLNTSVARVGLDYKFDWWH